MKQEAKIGLYLNFVERHPKIFRLLCYFIYALLLGIFFIVFSTVSYIVKGYSNPVVMANTVRVDKLNTPEIGKDFRIFFSYDFDAKTFYGNEDRRFYQQPSKEYYIRIDPVMPSSYTSVDKFRMNSIKRISHIVIIFIFFFFSFFFICHPYWKAKRLRYS